MKVLQGKAVSKEVLSVVQMRKARREDFFQNYPTCASQRQYILNWFDRNQLTTGVLLILYDRK